jgi:hypothetical protein
MRRKVPGTTSNFVKKDVIRERSYPYAEYSKYDKEDNLKEMPVAVIGDLEQHKLSRSERIHDLEQESQSRRTRQGDPLTDSVNVATSAHTKLLHIVLMRNIWLISCEKTRLKL